MDNLDNRITINENTIKVKYYTTEEVKNKTSLYNRLFTSEHDLCQLTNNKNRVLHEYAQSIAISKNIRLMICPLMYAID